MERYNTTWRYSFYNYPLIHFNAPPNYVRVPSHLSTGGIPCLVAPVQGVRLRELWLYPVKSLGGMKVEATQHSIQAEFWNRTHGRRFSNIFLCTAQKWCATADQGLLYDRGWAVVDAEGKASVLSEPHAPMLSPFSNLRQAMTQKEVPQMSEITASIVVSDRSDGPSLVLSKRGMEPLEVPLAQLEYGSVIDVRVCGDRCTATAHTEATVRWDCKLAFLQWHVLTRCLVRCGSQRPWAETHISFSNSRWRVERPPIETAKASSMKVNI